MIRIIYNFILFGTHSQLCLYTLEHVQTVKTAYSEISWISARGVL